MARDDDDEKKQRHLLDRMERFWQQSERPFAKLMRGLTDETDRIKKLTEPSASFKKAMQAAEDIKKAFDVSPGLKKMTDSLDRMTKGAGGFSDILEQRQQQAEQQKAALAAEIVEVASSRRELEELHELQLHRQRVFVALVQTRALFHDCKKVAKLEPHESYTALAPHIVLAAFDIPLDEIDDDVSMHAELFVRALVGGANG